MPIPLPLQSHISQNSTRKRMYRTLVAQYGDGYSQEAPNGINNAVDEWNVIFENLDTSERTTLISALDTVKSSDYFTWTAPGDTSEKRFKVSVDGWTESPRSGDLWTISFTLKQVF